MVIQHRDVQGIELLLVSLWRLFVKQFLQISIDTGER